MALSAAELLGSELCGVDFLVTKDGPKLMEINFTPGLIPKFFENKLAEKMVSFLADKAKEIELEKEQANEESNENGNDSAEKKSEAK